MKVFQFEAEAHYDVTNLLNLLPPSYIYFVTIHNQSDKWLCQITSEFLTLEQLEGYMSEVIQDCAEDFEFYNVREL